MDTEQFSQVTETGRQMAEQAQEQLHETAETGKEWAGKARDTARQAAETAQAYVRDYPWATVALVSVLAVSLGYLLGSRRD